LLFGNTLVVQGDSAANVVTIDDAGNGSISANIDGVTGSGTAIKNVIVNTKGGNDSVTYNLNGPATSRLNLAIDLGALQDGSANTNSATFDFHGNAISSPYLNIGVLGTKGADTVTATLGAITNSYVNLAAFLGDGDDTFDTTVTGDVSGNGLAIAAFGGN